MKRTFTLVLSLFVFLVSFSQTTLFSTGFEGPDFDPGWTIGMSTDIEQAPYDYPSGLDPWDMWDIHDELPQGYVHSGDSAAFIGGTLTLQDKYDWLMSPQFAVPENSATDVNYWMWYHSAGPSYWTWFYIMVYDVAEDKWELGELILYEENMALHYVEEYSFDLRPWEGKEVRVAFVKRGTYQFAMDDINCISIELGNDLAVNAILTPSNENGCVFGADEEIKIRLENPGILDINTFDVQYTINNSIVVTETVNEEILAGETLDYTFNEKADLSVFGDYIIDVEAIVEDDENSSNNEMSTLVVSSDATITIEILTDQFSPGDNSWILTDSENNTIASAEIGDLPSSDVYIVDVCVLSNECYTFTIYDEFGDGISSNGTSGYLTVYYNGNEAGGFNEEGADFGTEFTVEEIGGGCSVNLKELNSHDILAYPNPVSDILFLEYSGEIQSVKIIDMLGREYIQQVEGTTNRGVIDFSSFESGLYLIEVNSQNNDFNTFLIQKR